MLSCARHGFWPPVRGAQGASYFGNGRKNVLSSQTNGPIGMQFGMRHQGNKTLSVYAPFPDPPPQRGWGTINPQIRHCLEKSFHTLLSRMH